MFAPYLSDILIFQRARGVFLLLAMVGLSLVALSPAWALKPIDHVVQLSADVARNPARISLAGCSTAHRKPIW